MPKPNRDTECILQEGIQVFHYELSCDKTGTSLMVDRSPIKSRSMAP